MTDLLHRNARLIHLAALGLMALSLLLLLRQLPFEQIDAGIRAWIRAMGGWAPLAFVAIYIACALLLLPASVLTVVAGAVWGMAEGSVYVMIGASVSVSASFLIARYAAREQMIAIARRSPRFRAVDEAITEGGWRIIALVRLTPVFPFGLQNYLYGLTGVGFWPAVLVSLPAMLPGTLLYVYLGYLTRAGAAATADGGVTTWAWALRGAGLVAAVAVVTYISRLARRHLRQITTDNASPEDQEYDMTENASAPAALPWKTVAVAMLAMLMFGGSVYAQFRPDLVHGLIRAAFGIPAVSASEAYEPRDAGPRFDHRRLDAVLARVVTRNGMVDYEALRGEPADDLAAYIEQLAALSGEAFDALDRDEKLALLLNAYNAWTLQLILDHWPLQSIMDIPEDQRWKADRWRLGPHTLSLDELEHQWLRTKFVEPRIHFAIVCASVGCPPLRNEAYVADRLEEQLEEQARIMHSNGSRWFAYDATSNTLRLTPLYDWFAADFERASEGDGGSGDPGGGDRLAFAARYSPALRAALESGTRPQIQWLDYDWSLNRAR